MDEELAYLAGFFDGEGSISIIKGKNGYSLVLSVSQLNPMPLIRLQSRFGGSVHRQPDRRGNRSMIVWTTAARRGLAAITAMRPFLIVKADEADVGIEFQSKLDEWTDRSTELARRADLHARLKLLKQRTYDHVELPETKREPRLSSPRRLVRELKPKMPKPPKAHRVKTAVPVKSTGYKRHVFDAADVAILRGIYADHGLAETAREYGVSRQTVVNWLDRYGIEKQGRTAESEKRRAAAVAASWSTYRSSLDRS